MKTRIYLTLFIGLITLSLAAQEKTVKQKNLADYLVWVELRQDLGLYTNKGRVLTMTDTTLLFQPTGKQGVGQIMLFYPNIEYIKVRNKRRVGDGMAIGLLTAGLAGAAITAATYKSEDFRSLVILGGGLLGGVGGLVVGVVIGSTKERYPIYGERAGFDQFRSKYRFGG